MAPTRLPQTRSQGIVCSAVWACDGTHRWYSLNSQNGTSWVCIDCALYRDISGNFQGQNGTAFNLCYADFARKREADPAFDVPKTAAPTHHQWGL